jgi:hypothetical protein
MRGELLAELKFLAQLKLNTERIGRMMEAFPNPRQCIAAHGSGSTDSAADLCDGTYLATLRVISRVPTLSELWSRTPTRRKS